MKTKVRKFLEKLLLNDAVPATVRDDANLLLADMDNSKSIPAYKKAIKKEKNPCVKKYLKITLIQLEKEAK